MGQLSIPLQSLGADRTIDYREKKWHGRLSSFFAMILLNFKASEECKDIDAVYDCVGENEVCKNANKVLKKGGHFVSIAAFTVLLCCL